MIAHKNGSTRNATFARLISLAMLMLLLLSMISSLYTFRQVRAAPVLISQGKTATSSSNENVGTTPNLAFDGNLTGTRWASAFSDPQWLQVDLGATYQLSGVNLYWEGAYGRSYQIQASGAATGPWTTLYSTTTGDGGTDNLAVSGTGRYVRMYGIARATGYGYSLWEMQVYGELPTSSTATRTNTVGAATATRTRTATRTNTVGAATATRTATRTNTVGAATATRTNTSAPPTATTCGTTNVAPGKTATASSALGGNTAAMAVDNNAGTRWESTHGVDPQWLQVDLGSTQSICRVNISWEGAYASAYQIQVSNDGTTFSTLRTVTGNTTLTNDLTGLSGSGRYVRIHGTARATGWGYSIWELQIFTGGSAPTNTTGPAATATRTNTSVPPTNTSGPVGCGTSNVALNKTATASSALTAATLAVDGNAGTRWESSQGVDPQWIQVDLGSTQSICRVNISWETASARDFTVQVSNDGTNFTSIRTVTGNTTLTNDLTGLSGSGRYVRIHGTARTTAYGYSIWELQIFTGGVINPTATSVTPPTATGVINATATRTSTPIVPTPTTGTGTCMEPNVPNFGPNVRIFEDSMSDATIQAQLDADFEAMKDTQAHQFAETRRAHLFKPGSYNVYDNVGFYLSVAGLGYNPTDVTINGAVTVDAFNASDAGNATQNFWRSAENLSINTNGGANRWGVAQAAPFRRINVIGGLNLYPASYGWASGGYTSDVRTTGLVASASQQQWYSKDSNYGGGWDGAVWNMVFSGVVGAPAPSFPASPRTVLSTTPFSRDVPYLYWDGSSYRVFLPSLRTNASGASWPNTAGTSLPMSQFYVVKPGDSAAIMNAALGRNCNLFFPPGIWHINETIRVNRANTVILGIGYPTIVNDNGVVAMQVGDVDGVRLKGILFDAGLTAAQAQLIVGTQGSPAGHAANPITIQDVFFRVGGQFAGKTINSMVVNANDTIIDHTWIWRGDHGQGIGWYVNTADTGLIVNGNNVLATGLFVEHYQKYQVIWNGQNGRTIFFQNEIGYEQPDQASWMNGTTRGYAAYKVADHVTSHEAWGLGSYIFMNQNTSVVTDRAFEVPVNAGVRFHNVSTVSLGNAGHIMNVINNVGGQTPTNSTPATIANYP